MTNIGALRSRNSGLFAPVIGVVALFIALHCDISGRFVKNIFPGRPPKAPF
jgi:hypothetical protein